MEEKKHGEGCTEVGRGVAHENGDAINNRAGLVGARRRFVQTRGAHDTTRWAVKTLKASAGRAERARGIRRTNEIPTRCFPDWEPRRTIPKGHELREVIDVQACCVRAEG